MNLNKLRGKMVEQGVRVSDLAQKTGISESALYRKFGNFEKITIGEAVVIKEVLNLTEAEACEIFLS